MVEKFKEYLKKSFSNGPKAKILLGLTALAVILTMTVVSMRKTVNISIDGSNETFVTYKGTVKDVLENQGIELGAKDKVQPSLESKVSENQEITIKKAVPVKVVIAGQELELETAEDTIGEMLVAETDMLKEKGIEYQEGDDIVTPSVDTPIESNLDVQVVQVTVEEVVETQVIPYSTKTEVDQTKDVSYKEVTRKGVNGEKEVTYKLVKHDGEVVSKEVVSQQPIKAAEDQLVVKGGAYITANRGGNIVGKKRLFMESTAYSGHGKTATGRTPVYNPGGLSTIAVDPRVIPLGSKVWVKGYGYAIAADTGGAIKGNIIDVYFNSSSQCRTWGRKYNVEVLIIAYPGEW